MDNIYFKSDENLLTIIKKAVVENVFPQKIYFGKIVTGEAFISENSRSEIIEKYNLLCVDMETASIAHVCYVNNIPFIAIRSINDTESEPGIETFETNCISSATNSINILEKILISI